ncbi:MAG: 50S ribosomal protein L18e [Candidatus Aenigmatarchaeota archaeon]
MVKRTGPTNPYLKNLIDILKSKSRELNAPIWKAIAEKLEKPTRRRVEVNLSKIDRYAKEGETIIVPGKVLAAGKLTKKVNIAAWQFSKQAEEKIKQVRGNVMTIEELLEKNPKGSYVKIIM